MFFVLYIFGWSIANKGRQRQRNLKMRREGRGKRKGGRRSTELDIWQPSILIVFGAPLVQSHYFILFINSYVGLFQKVCVFSKMFAFV